MGQHKYNPVAIAAKNGELPPKPKKLSKREREAYLQIAVEKAMRKRDAYFRTWTDAGEGKEES